jgi:cytochrome b6-f complex iron-sulfur subunit
MVGLRRLAEDSRDLSRRSFLAVLGWGGFSLASLIALYESVRFLYPNATYEEPSLFKAGTPSDYPIGAPPFVDLTKRVVINHDQKGIYAFNLICTHLGCTPRYFPDVTSDLVAKGIRNIRDPLTGLAATAAQPALQGFKCPCHGSRYFVDSVNFYGPAPRPMDHISVTLGRDGKLLIDRRSFVDLTYRLKV